MITNDVFVERRSLGAGTSLSHDIADHLYTRPFKSKVVILTDQPGELMSAVVRRWRRITLQLRRELSSTLNAQRKQELLREIAWMDATQFSAKPKHHGSAEVVSFVAAKEALSLATASHTLYITRQITEPALHLLAHWVFARGLMVVYERGA